MASDISQVDSLKLAIIERARTLAEEHTQQGRMTRTRIMEDAREKVQLMEQKELLAAKDSAERMYQRRVQASEIKLQAELDRNRWGLVQSVMDRVQQRVVALAASEKDYDPVFRGLLKQGAKQLAGFELVALLNMNDRQRYQKIWPDLCEEIGFEIELSEELCDCSGGVRLYTTDRDMLVDNTFDGLIERRQDALMRVVYERLFATVQSRGVNSHG